VIANGVTGVIIYGLSLVNGVATDAAGASGGCMFVGDDAGLQLISVTLRNCSAPGERDVLFNGTRFSDLYTAVDTPS
jgi:hypothetical protein